MAVVAGAIIADNQARLGSVQDASAASFGRPVAALLVPGPESVSHARYGSLEPGVSGADAARGVDEPADGGRLIVAPPERVEDDVSGRWAQFHERDAAAHLRGGRRDDQSNAAPGCDVVPHRAHLPTKRLLRDVVLLGSAGEVALARDGDDIAYLP